MANDFRPNMNMPQSPNEVGPSVARGAYWPTCPRQSLNPNSWSVIRLYSCGMAPADVDNTLNIEATRVVRFDLPTTVLAVCGGVALSDGSGFPLGMNPLDSFSIALLTANGERITIDSRLAGSVVGTASRPGFLAGGGWPFSAGSALTVLLTPRLAGLQQGVKLKIDLTFHCLEVRSGSSVDKDGSVTNAAKSI